MQSVLGVIFPPQCISCGEPATEAFGLCGTCWCDTPFIGGLVCDRCGTPLPGEDEGRPEFCDDCLMLARPWDRGRAALLYRDNGRKLVLALKHGDRLDLVRPTTGWLIRAAQPILKPGMLVVPVPLHWTRLLRRKYNQSALLSRSVARALALDHVPDLLIRARRTRSQDGRNRDDRFGNVAGAIRVQHRHAARLSGRDVLLIDDVMTSGATLAAAADACLAAGAYTVSTLVLARVAKDA